VSVYENHFAVNVTRWSVNNLRDFVLVVQEDRRSRQAVLLGTERSSLHVPDHDLFGLTLVQIDLDLALFGRKERLEDV